MVDGHNHLGWISPPVFIDTKKQKTNSHKLSFFRLKVDPTTQLPPSNPRPQNLKGLAICVLFFYFTYHSCYFKNKKQKTYKKKYKSIKNLKNIIKPLALTIEKKQGYLSH